MSFCEEKYSEGLSLFEECNYVKAVEAFIEVYNQGFRQEEIVDDIYSCFITPNEDEFLQNYKESRMSNKDIVDELAVDFIPVAENVFFYYNKLQKSFGNILYLKDSTTQELCKEFERLLIVGLNDLSSVLSAMSVKNWSKIYIILGQEKCVFYSLFKLPEFEGKYMDNVVLFDTEEQFIDYFSSNNEYLPKTVISNDNEKYLNIIDELHKIRIEDMDKVNNNVFLSICIPTYNRGNIALNSVNNILKLKYDSEIEIVISNNGSVDNTEGYEKIKNIKDNRIRYFEFEENQGYASNVRKVLEESKGKFAVVASDEDLMIIQNVGQYMTYLLNNMETGIVLSTGYGNNFCDESERTYKKGFEAVIKAMNSNYVTGTTFNMKYFKERNVLARFDANRGNRFVEDYAHCVMAMMTSEESDVRESGIYLWDAREEAVSENGQVKIQHYTLPENRIIQQNSAVDFLYKAMELPDEDFLNAFMERVRKTYFLVKLAGVVYREEYLNKYKWVNVCKRLHINNLELVDIYFGDYEEELKNQIKDILLQYYIENIKDDFQNNIVDDRAALIQLTLANIIAYRLESKVSIYDIDVDLLEEKISEII
ncbi:MAG: glycosyltransferase family 2 protein [Lachnospiraceae bacterium]|nr:glycosyltransferase family 2 protein [Lachnospiraceae bacterium]